ncbi:MAG: nitric oxide reductase large subunit [Phenylobacterium sp. RIFCSPHIGHO2_01_FULL_69_31]|jgi:nitric oxide reductase subunit B|uniref:nitric-oxide reductase large subunit n=1 Tax=Phenylobacterium sp. RIFCSPHIGHO2_01_FULL_69_31 TaxID=1801944 RepID=UPI0008BC94A8|nr:nitric-oxide reductase large subunit [Phenylobacterium sp. RIFCSPHIGHO2_01_FULL_69_31]OHB31508.1 MAG: nitric oxide reductase large subunit [Phenylobacterium sp. RIFCSPHIGHO2_01_FULL_69_31]
MNTRRLWFVLALVMAVSFTVLGLMGREIHRQAPPIPASVVDPSGAVLMTRQDIQTGQLAWQSMGGQQSGSIWGHGGYVAPDWSADQLHREAMALLDIWAQREHGKAYAALGAEPKAALQARLKAEMRTNTYNPETGVITVSKDRALALRQVKAHYVSLYSDTPELEALREQYAVKNGAVPDLSRREAIANYYWWTAWAAATNRPDDTVSYTSNWPHEPLVGNTPSSANVVWSVASILLLIFGVGALVFWHARTKTEDHLKPPVKDPLLDLKPTPSMRATGKYFLTVIGLFLLQVGLGALTAHYAVEGHDFYGVQISDVIPYAVTRTWHTQLAVFWIATAWLATGLYVAPMISGHEPKFQKLGVNVLWGALVFVVLGSMAGEWLGVQQVFDLDTNFWFGHQGWEYIDLGRFWQSLLFVGLMLWLVLVTRALAPALKGQSDSKPTLWILFLSTVAIGLFYAAGFMWGKHSHISMVEYWRWWVVHLWVEGFFEVFATAVISLLLVKLGLVRPQSANGAVIFGTIVFMFGGVLGTAHHWYFAGTPVSVIAIGSVFSALEVVPLALIGAEAFENWRHSKAAPWVSAYKWPILFFVAVAFWNLLGAGVFGFMINPPISLYYIQGLNTTATHAHAALFGVYGMLGIGLLLFCFRGLARREAWSDRLLGWTFWLLNGGLAMMLFMSLLPMGVVQAFASIEHGYWYARSPETIHSTLMETLVWLRVPGDIVFSAGAFTLALFAARLFLSRGKRQLAKPEEVPLPIAAE